MAAARGRSCCFFGAHRVPVSQQCGDAQEVIGQHRGAHQNLEAIASFCPAAFHSSAAEQHGDAPLDADAKALALFELRAALHNVLLRALLATALRDAYLTHSGLLAVVHMVGAVKARSPAYNSGTWWKVLDGGPAKPSRGWCRQDCHPAPGS